ncbi:ATP-binding cassette sub- G member 2 [Stylosanthes scabra]|uniref:ATP-binding cassette sub- G member 2 n=1 Tax=Stylosanthes scabra TaxID=79078 RepID=A0ABU6UC15_9FABA|nr:ATP-binding cassette sub- G member 2 [Stylosanthes scabra]
MVVMFTTFDTCAVEAIPVVLQIFYIFIREISCNVYCRSSYILTHSIISLPFLVFLSLAFAATNFWAVGLVDGINGFLFYFLTIVALAVTVVLVTVSGGGGLGFRRLN